MFFKQSLSVNKIAKNSEALRLVHCGNEKISPRKIKEMIEVLADLHENDKNGGILTGIILADVSRAASTECSPIAHAQKSTAERPSFVAPSPVEKKLEPAA